MYGLAVTERTGSADPITLAELRTHLRLEDGVEATYLGHLISAASLAVEDADALDQSFGWPFNLATTEDGDSTDWIGAEYIGSPAIRMTGNPGAAMRLDTIHNFRCTARTRPALT